MRHRFFMFSALTLAALSAHATVSFTTPSTTYSQNFDTLVIQSSRGTAFANDSTINGWALFKSDNTAGGGYLSDDGTGLYGGSAGFHSLGSVNSSERSLGMLPAANSSWGTPSPTAGSPAGWIALAATNNTGAALSAFTLGYAGEQWYVGDSNVPSTLKVQYGFGSTFAGVTSWTAAGEGFNFSTPVQSMSATSVDGNAAGHVSGLGGTVGGLNWNNGDTLWIRWEGTAGSSIDSMGIDDVSLSVSAVPEPGSVPLMLGGLGLLSLIARRRLRA